MYCVKKEGLNTEHFSGWDKLISHRKKHMATMMSLNTILIIV